MRLQKSGDLKFILSSYQKLKRLRLLAWWGEREWQCNIHLVIDIISQLLISNKKTRQTHIFL